MNNRLQSLDFFRGLTIAFMIIVNTAGGPVSYWPLEHAKWHGFTPTDLVFPSFVFITGVSTWFSMIKFNHTYSADALKKIWRRTLIIFLLGVGLYAFPFYNRPIGTWRILGVLQRIALCYGIGATAVMFLNKKQVISLIVLLLLGYWGIMSFFGDLSLENSAERQLDLFLFGEGHLYHGEGIAFDPEGLLSTMPALGTYLIGYLVGQFIGQNKDKQLILRQLLMWGAILVIAGFLWNFVFPINKKLWTSSYVLFVGGLSTLIFSFSYWLLDMLQLRGSWSKFFIILGTNAILAYMVSELLVIALNEFIHIPDASGEIHNGHWWLMHTFITSWAGMNEFSSFLGAVFFMLLCWLVVYVFYRKGIYLKV